MKPKKRQKLCHHCEGEVDLDVIVCPFCAADLREERPEQPRFQPLAASIKNPTEQSLYPPPYSEPKTQPIQYESVEQEEEVLPQEDQIAETSSIKPASYGILLFALGAQLLFLGIAFLLFSNHGMLLLRFNANWWPLCLLFSFPLLVFGYRTTKIT
jgi:hypothetical protein